MRTFAAILGTTFALALPAAADASLIGDSVTCSQIGGGSFTCSAASATVGVGSEFRVGNAPARNQLDINVSSGTITFTALDNLSLGSTIVKIGDLDWIGEPGAYLADADLFDNVSGLSASDLTFTGDSITLDLRSTSWARGNFAAITLTSASKIPEPATLSLIALAFAGIGFARRRSR